MKKLAIVLILILAPAVSFADTPFYKSGNLYTGYNLVHYKDFGAGGVNGFTFQAGYDIASWLALEGHLGLSDDASQTISGTTVKVHASYASIVGRFNLRFDRTTVYGFVGTTYLQMNGNVSGATTGTIDESDTGATYGVGVDLYGSENAAITFKATRVFHPANKNSSSAKITTDVDTTMFGFTYYM